VLPKDVLPKDELSKDVLFSKDLLVKKGIEVIIEIDASLNIYVSVVDNTIGSINKIAINKNVLSKEDSDRISENNMLIYLF